MPRAVWNGATIAESDDTVIVEGNHYFAPESLRREHFIDSTHTSVCGWKGQASYYHLDAGGQRNENGAWYYPEPKEAARDIAGRVAFGRGVQVIP